MEIEIEIEKFNPDVDSEESYIRQSYDGKDTEYYLLFRFVWASNECHEIETIQLTPNDAFADACEQLIFEYDGLVNGITAELPSRGVWRVVAVVKISHYVDYYGEVDVEGQSKILSANKFLNFGELRYWVKTHFMNR